MPIASGVAKSVAIKKESTWGVPAGTASGKYLRRTSSDLNLQKETYESGEIRTDYQVADMRHGVRSVRGNISGELSPSSYQDFFGSALRKAWTTVSSLTSLTLTVAGSGPSYTVTRSAGDFTSSGLKIGMVVRITAGLANAANVNKNLVISAMTTTVLTVFPLNGVAMAAEGPTGSSTIAIPGRQVWTPTTGHLDESYSIEHWFSDISQSELFVGCKVADFAVGLPPTGLSTARFGFMGSDLASAAARTVATNLQYFASPTAASTSGLLASVNGVILVQGARVALLTGLTFDMAGGMTAEPVVGSNVYPDINEGRVRVTGEASAFFEDATLRDLFVNETEATIVGAFSTGNANADEFMTFSLGRIKLGGASKNDGERGIVQSLPFTGLVSSTGNFQASTLMIHDSLAT